MAEEQESQEGIYCQNCGQYLSSDAQFCDRCGSEVRESTASVEATEEQESTRRKWLKYGGGTIVALAGAGAIGSFVLGLGEPNHEGIGAEAWEMQTEGSRYMEGTITLEEGQWTARQITVRFSGSIVLEVSVKQGDFIDVWVIDQADSETYRDGDEVSTYSGVSKEGVSNTSLSGRLGDGNYFVIFDNSAAYGTEPSGKVVVDMSLQLGQ